MKRALRRLDPSDWVLIGYLIGLLVIWIAETAGQDSTPTRRTEQSVRLDEEHLERIEDGESVQVRRWHGHDLVLEGDLVIDVDRVHGED